MKVKVNGRPATVELKMAPVFGLPGPVTSHVVYADGSREIVDSSKVEAVK